MMSLDRDAGGVVTCPANLMDGEICKPRPVQRTADLRAIFREEDSYTKPCIDCSSSIEHRQENYDLKDFCNNHFTWLYSTYFLTLR